MIWLLVSRRRKRQVIGCLSFSSWSQLVSSNWDALFSWNGYTHTKIFPMHSVHEQPFTIPPEHVSRFFFFLVEWHVDSGPCLLFALDNDVCFVHLMFWSFQFAISISIYFSLAFQADGSLINYSCQMWGIDSAFWITGEGTVDMGVGICVISTLDSTHLVIPHLSHATCGPPCTWPWQLNGFWIRGHQDILDHWVKSSLHRWSIFCMVWM